ncbi:MAG: tetratricopeptide repeat protein [Tannerella sp.]|jgi:signal transduction histidine kinase/Flp pilus assembly protein TadD|nr:tetratricopeptide repeat protein [Tannerella sp.]
MILRIFLLMLLIPLSSYGQEAQNSHAIIDSLKNLLNTQKLTVKKEIKVCASLGMAYISISEFDSARIYLNRTLSLPGGREFDGGRFITNLGNSYGFQGRYAEALKYYMEALKVSENLVASGKDFDYNYRHGKLNIVRTAANLAEVYYLTGNREQALYYAERAREEQNFLPEGLGAYMIPQYLYVIASVYLDRGELDGAEEIMRETYEIADSLCRIFIRDYGNPRGMYWYVAYGEEGLARVSLARKNYAEALERNTEALQYAELHGDPSVTAKVLATFSDIYQAQGNFEESGRFVRKALKTYPDYPKLHPEVLSNMAAARLFAGDREGTYEYIRLYSEQMKANTDKQFRETMAGMEIQYETEKKDLRISYLERNRTLYVILLVFAVLMIAFAAMFFRQRLEHVRHERQLAETKARQEKEEAETEAREKGILEGEMEEQKRIAVELHHGVQGLLMETIQHLDDKPEAARMVRAAHEEVRRIAAKLMSKTLEMCGLRAALEDYCRQFLNVEFYFAGTEMRASRLVENFLYRSAQELIANSLKHAEAKEISVHLVQDEEQIYLTVCDDGKGYDVTETFPGIGIEYIRNRVKAFGGTVDIASSPGNGTETIVAVGVKENT